MKKRILALILSLTMIFTMSALNLSAIAKATDPTITLESIEAENGEEVTIKVLIENNPGIWGMDLKISYDKTALTLTSVDNGDFYQASEWTKGNLSADVYVLSYEASDFDNITTQSGILAILNFKVSDTAVAGDYAVTASYNVGDIINVSFDDINFNITNGKVAIKAKPVAATGVSLDKDAVSLNTGISETLIATVLPNNATNKNVIWKSSDTTTAIVDNNGKVTALKKGTTTITVTTVDGGFTDTCTVTVTCSHSNTTIHPAKASTCLEQGNEAYITCDDCGELVSGSDAKLPLGGHTGGTATCESKAICTVCQQPYGEYAAHLLTNHSAVVADHNQSGNIEYWTCDVCDKFFGDATGTNEITEADTKTDKLPHSHATTYSYNSEQHWRECECENKIEVAEHDYDNACDTGCNVCDYTRSITHNYSAVWSSDGTNHWRECAVCHEKIDVTAHSGGTATCTEQAICTECDTSYGEMLAHNNAEVVDEKHLKSEATCASKAVYYKSCSVCKMSSAETFEFGEPNAENHIGETEIKDAVKATCTTDGYSGDVYCKDCGENLRVGEIILARHDYGTIYNTDAENHWKECGCGSVTEKSKHTLGKWTVIKEASATERGRKERVCIVCGYKEIEEASVLTVNSPKTGDHYNFGIWLALFLIFCFGIVETVVRKKRM